MVTRSHRNTRMLYGLAWLVYAIFAFKMFPRLNSDVLFPILVLAGIGGFHFGKTKGLLIFAASLVLQYAVFQFFADQYEYYYNRAIGTFIGIIIIFLTGSLKHNLDAIREASLRLDRTVEERTRELTNLTSELIERSEAMRVAYGQQLHDGIGQQLTGILLYSSALASSLIEEGNSSAALAHSVMNRARSTHELIRHAARSLFPVQIGRVGLLAAINEMAACLKEIRNTSIHVQTPENLTDIPQSIPLQTYRICQETTLLLLQAAATHIDIEITVKNDNLILSIEHDGLSVAGLLAQAPAARLIEYRLKQVSGKMDMAKAGAERLLFTIPRRERSVAA